MGAVNQGLHMGAVNQGLHMGAVNKGVAYGQGVLYLPICFHVIFSYLYVIHISIYNFFYIQFNI